MARGALSLRSPGPAERRRPPLGPRALGLLCVAAAIAGAGEVHADAAVERALAGVIRQRYAALHACYRLSLSEDRSKGGTLFLRLTLGARGALAKVELARDELGHKRTASCVVKQVKGWGLSAVTAAGATAGSELLMPLTFRADSGQFSVRVEDAPAVATSGGERRSLLNKRNVGAARAELALLVVRTRMTLRGAGERALYVLAGSGRLRHGQSWRTLRTGGAVWLPPGALVELVARGRRPLRALQVQLSAARAVGRSTSPIVVRSSRVRARARGRIRSRALLHPRNLGHRRLYLGIMEHRRGSSRRSAGASTDLLYVLSGSGTIQLGSRSVKILPGSAALLPPARAARLLGAPRFRAVQVLVPAR